jgi:hypothetical protein
MRVAVLLFIFIPQGNGKLVITLPLCLRAGRTLESQCISLSRQGHECIDAGGDKTDLPVVRVILLAEMCGKIEC